MFNDDVAYFNDYDDDDNGYTAQAYQEYVRDEALLALVSGLDFVTLDNFSASAVGDNTVVAVETASEEDAMFLVCPVSIDADNVMYVVMDRYAGEALLNKMEKGMG